MNTYPSKILIYLYSWNEKRKLDGQIKPLADSGEQPDVDICFVNANEQSKKVSSSSTEAELSLLFQNMSVAGTKPVHGI